LLSIKRVTPQFRRIRLPFLICFINEILCLLLRLKKFCHTADIRHFSHVKCLRFCCCL
jgi:hypothetical protein